MFKSYLKNYAALVLGLALIAFLVGLLVGDVGELPDCSEPHSRWMPLKGLLLLGGLFLLGVEAGLDLAKEKQRRD